MTSSIAACAFAALLAAPPLAAEAAGPSLTVHQYAAALDAIEAAADQSNASRARAAAASLPVVWQIKDPPLAFEVPTASIKAEIAEWIDHGSEPSRRALLGQIRTLRAEADLYQRPAPDHAGDRARLSAILAGREFQNIHGPTWFDDLRQRALMAIMRWLARSIPLSVVPAIGSLVVYLLILMAVLATGLAIFGNIRSRSEMDHIAPQAVVSSRSWSDWLAAAQTAAARGQWREAVRSSYWCGVSFLESSGRWRPDRARTPREYLRLLSSSDDQSRAFADLTYRCERIWYGHGTADASAFAESIEDLKRLGCSVA